MATTIVNFREEERNMPNEKAPRKCCPGPGSLFLAGIDRGHYKDEKQVSDHISCLNPPTPYHQSRCPSLGAGSASAPAR